MNQDIMEDDQYEVRVGMEVTYIHRDGDKIICIITEIDEEIGITSMKAKYPREELGKLGFIKEGEDYINMKYFYELN